MASFRPFRALRPTPEAAAAIAAVPYDVVNREEAAALAAGNALSFLHVSRAEIDLPPEIDPYSDAVYRKAAANFQALRAYMVQDEEPSMYFYRLRMGDHEQTGLCACYSIDEYTHDTVKKHEKTRRDKEDDRTRHIIDLRAQTGPVFLTYRQSEAVDAIAARVCAGNPLYRLTAPDGVVHTIWRVDAGATTDLVTAFGAFDALYIADGHHRAASGARAHAHFGGDTQEEHAWCLGVAFPDNQTQVLPYHRAVKDLGGRTPNAFLDEVGRHVTLEPGEAAARHKGECQMYLAGRWYTLTLQPAGPNPGDDPIKSLDASLLQDLLLEPVLGIKDLRTDKRIDFVGGIRGTGELERLVDSGVAAAAFSMYPVTVAELMAVADAGAIMPPKSTWFEPKLRDGLLIHLI